MAFIAGVVAALVAITGLLVVLAVWTSRSTVRAEMKRRSEPYRPGRRDDFVTSEERGGVRRVLLAPDTTLSAMISGRLDAAGVPHQITQTDGGGHISGAPGAAHVLFHQAADDDVVAQVLADVDDRATEP